MSDLTLFIIGVSVFVSYLIGLLLMIKVQHEKQAKATKEQSENQEKAETFLRRIA
jgi:hypothetical protein